MLDRQILVSLGLTEKEARLYQLLTEQGSMSGGEIERQSGLKKNTYVLLKSLMTKKLVTANYSEGKRFYLPTPPDSLMALIAEQKRAVVQTGKAVESLLPELWNSYREHVGRPVVQYYAGLAGLRSVFDKVYEVGKDSVWAVVGNETIGKKFFAEIIGHYLPLRKKNKIWAYTISPDGPRARELKKTESKDLKTKYLVDPKKYPMPAEFDTWGNYIALMSFSRGDFSSVLIEHPDLAKTMQSLMKLTADLLQERENDEKNLYSNI